MGADGSVSVGVRATCSGCAYLELLLVQLHLLQLVPGGARPPAALAPLQEAQLQVAQTLLQIRERVTKLKEQNVPFRIKAFKRCLFPGFPTVTASAGRIFSISVTANEGFGDVPMLKDAHVWQQFPS